MIERIECCTDADPVHFQTMMEKIGVERAGRKQRSSGKHVMGRDGVESGGPHRLAFEPPLDWPHLLGFLRMRRIAGVELIDDQGYHRSVRLEPSDDPRVDQTRVGALHARLSPDGAAVEVELSASLEPVAAVVLQRLSNLFDLDCPPLQVAAVLGELARGHEGIRRPGAFDAFEIAARAVLGQQVTVKAACTLAGRMAAAFGMPLGGGAGHPAAGDSTPLVAFPSASRIAGLEPEQIVPLGVMAARARTLVGLARAMTDGRIDLVAPDDPQALHRALVALPGIGEWTAQYIAMRALSLPDAFPASDLGVLRSLGVRKPAEAIALAERWRPWRAYAVVHLWSRGFSGG